jgi:ATP-dependent DNA helicase RecG
MDDPVPTSALPISIHDLLYSRGIETARVELKSGWNEGPTGQQVLQTICAFANDYYNVNGGYIVLGVAELEGVAQLPPSGVKPSELERMQRWIRGNCQRMEPVYQPVLSHEVVAERHLLVIWAFGSMSRPHSLPGERAGDRRFWVRLGAETVEAREAILTELLRMTAWVPFDDQPAPRFQVNDLRSTLVREVLQEIGSALVDEPDDREMYRALRLVQRMNGHEAPRNVALLFFSDSPDRIFPGARIDVVRFQDDAGGDVLEEHIFRGPLHRQVRDCLSFLGNLIGQFVRKHPDRPEASTWAAYPLAAIEEAVANAVHHRDYRSEQPTKVYLYLNELTVTSYPGPVPGLRLEDFTPGRRIPQVPARNRRIGELLKELKLAEARSTGVPKIFRAMRDNGSPEPSFEFDEGRTYFTVVLPIHPESLAEREPAAARDDFLSRVEAVCRLREPGAEVERIKSAGASGGYLRVARKRGAVVDLFPVGAVEDGFTREHLQAFLADVDAKYRRHAPGLISILVVGGEPVAQELVEEAAAQGVRVMSFVEYQGLAGELNQ